MCGDAHPISCARCIFMPDVALAGAVVTHEDGAEPGRVTVGDELLDARLEVGEHRVGHRPPGIIFAGIASRCSSS